MILLSELERLREENSFKFEDSKKNKLYNNMFHHAKTAYILSEPFYIQLTMEYRMGMSDELLSDYSAWLKNSKYYNGTEYHHVMDNISPYDQFGKLSVFKEFLLDYKGEALNEQ